MPLQVLTRKDWENIALAELQAYLATSPSKVVLVPAKMFEDGSDLNLVTHAGIAMAEEVMRQAMKGFDSLFVDTAQGADLDKLALDRFSLARKGAAYATVAVTFARPTFAAGGGTINKGTVLTAPNGMRFDTMADVVFGATDLSKIGDAVCEVSGPGGNVDPGTFTGTFFDASIVATTQQQAAGGSAVETDDQFRHRIRNFFSTQQRGTLAALEQGALTVPGVGLASAFDILDPNTGKGSGQSEVIVSDLNGNSSPAMVSAVLLVLFSWKPAGGTVTVLGGTVVYQSITIHITYQAGIDTILAQDAARNAVIAAVNGLSNGSTLYVSTIIAALKSVQGVIVPQNAVSVPTGDVTPTSGQIIRVRAQDITFV